MRLEHDWFDRDLPANVVLDDHVYLHSAYAFLHYRSTQPVGVRLGAHTAAYDTTMFDLGPSGVVEVGRYGLLNGPHFIAVPASSSATTCTSATRCTSPTSRHPCRPRIRGTPGHCREMRSNRAS